MNGCSTQRVRRFRDRQEEAGRKRITLYLDRETQSRLDQLAGDNAQARYLETLVKAAIEREWAALADRQKDDPRRKRVDDQVTLFSGRRRSPVSGR